MVFGVLSGPFSSVILNCCVMLFKEERTYLENSALCVWCCVVARLDDMCFSGGLTSFLPFLDMVELDGGQRGSSPELMVHQGMRYKLHIFRRVR